MLIYALQPIISYNILNFKKAPSDITPRVLKIFLSVFFYYLIDIFDKTFYYVPVKI